MSSTLRDIDSHPGAGEYAASVVHSLLRPLVVLAPDFVVKAANPAFYRLFELDPMETLGRSIFEIGGRRWDIPELRTLLQDVLSKHEAVTDVELSHHFDGVGRKDLVLNGTRLTRGGLLLLEIGDVTARKRAERAREREKALLETVLDTLPVGLVIADSRGRIVRDNAVAREIWGISLEADSWEDYAKFVGWWPETGERLRADEWAMTRALRDGEVTRNELIRYQKLNSDEQGYYLNNVAPIRNAEGVVTGAVGAMLDVTERRTAEEELERAREEAVGARGAAERAQRHLQTVFEQAPVVMATFEGPDHVIGIQNEAHRKLLGLRSRDGNSLPDGVPDLDGEGFHDLLDQVYQSDEAYVGAEIPWMKDPGSEGEEDVLFFNVVLQPITDSGGEVEGIVLMAVDVTEVVRSRREAEKANRAKSEFMERMSHELRTPLNAIIGYTDLLLDGIPEQVPPAAVVQVQRVERGARHLRELIEEVLTFSGLEAGSEITNREEVSVPEMLTEIEAILEPECVEGGIRLEMNVRDGIDRIRTDATKLRQILINLIGNACKYTDEGRVQLAVTSHEKEGGTEVVFEVTDTGRGIRAEDMEWVFEPFWQGEGSQSDGTGGVGLGLAISKRFAGMLGGHLSVESTPGEGSTFTLRIPG